MTKSYELAQKYLQSEVKVIVDRKLGSKHPKHEYVYPVNYGFIPDTRAPDGAELDVYILGVNDPLDEFAGTCIAIVYRQDDDDDKLVVVPKGVRLTDDEILKATHFQEQWFDSTVLRH